MQPTLLRTGAPAVVAYKQKYHKQINQYLRSRQFSPPLGPHMEALLKGYSKDLRALMSTGLNTDQYPMLYRGTDYPEFDLRGKNYAAFKKLEGQSRTWRGFVSTTYDIIIAEKFCKGVVIFFHPSADTKFLDLARYRDLTKHNQEKEILLDHLTKGRIVKVSKAANASGLMPYVKVDVAL